MGKQNGKVISKPSSYVLKTWETMNVFSPFPKRNRDEKDKLNETEKKFDNLDALKNCVKSDIWRKRSFTMHWYRGAKKIGTNFNSDVFSVVNTDNEGTIYYSDGENDYIEGRHFYDIEHKYYKVEDENGKAVSVDWSDVKDFFDMMNEPDSGKGYFVCDCLAFDDDYIETGDNLCKWGERNIDVNAIIIGKYDNWKLPEDIIDNPVYSKVACNISIHKTLDECFDYIKELYVDNDKIYGDVFYENVRADVSLDNVEFKLANDRIWNMHFGSNDDDSIDNDRNKAAEAISSGIQTETDSQMSDECDDTN